MADRRLTEEVELPFDTTYKPKCEPLELGCEVTLTQMMAYDGVCNELGQIEDVEDDIGISLVTLHKALKNGLYMRARGLIYFIRPHYIAYYHNYFYITELATPLTLEIKDHGSKEDGGWALTKEALE